MENSPLWTVGLGTLTISGTSALVTGFYTAVKRTPHAGLVVGAATLNSAVTGAAFFVIREFTVSPALTRLAPFDHYARRRQILGIDPPNDSMPLSSVISPSDVRKDKILDSAVSGAATGAILRGIRSGRTAIFPGIMIGTIAAALVQRGYNELNLARLRYISKLNQENRTAVPTPVVKPRDSPPDPVPKTTWVDVLLRGIGLTPISDEEYLSKMIKTREGYLKRIEELEKQLEDEKSLEDLSKS